MIAEEIIQHAKGDDDRETIITEELKSHLEGLLKKETKRKSKGTFEDRGDLGGLWAKDF